ncbi:HNH endonuclease [Janthinobacterium sp. RA13]|uniref:HNH endonuclease n=1 Tax=Janthinobacterium sp. RA13 TaxID=1502762 RepID=UPI0009DE66A4|nr:HNH endonuclease signature motif containing protein [Janthinobacterium sp. RA13]
MTYNARSENINDKLLTRKWLDEHPKAAAQFEHVLNKLRPHYTGDNQGYIDKPEYRFNDVATGGYIIVKAQVSRVVVVLEPGLSNREEFKVNPTTFNVDVQKLLTDLAARKPKNFDWSKGSVIDPDHEIEEAGPPDELQQRAIKIRRGQKKFRDSLLVAYSKSCAISGCKIVEILEAAHIKPHANKPNYSVTNGLLLRADLHTLFDLGLLAVDARLRVRLAPALLSSEYKNLEGKELRQPLSKMPNKEALEERYRDFQAKHLQHSYKLPPGAT